MKPLQPFPMAPSSSAPSCAESENPTLVAAQAPGAC